ncbi:hypothetical protein ACP70R_012195 [Stipagrostis hirtigluma subsp. patula]
MSAESNPSPTTPRAQGVILAMSEVVDSTQSRRSPPPPSPSPSMPRFQHQPSGRQPPPPGSDPFAFGVVAFIAAVFLLSQKLKSLTQDNPKRTYICGQKEYLFEYQSEFKTQKGD